MDKKIVFLQIPQQKNTKRLIKLLPEYFIQQFICSKTGKALGAKYSRMDQAKFVEDSL